MREESCGICSKRLCLNRANDFRVPPAVENSRFSQLPVASDSRQKTLRTIICMHGTEFAASAQPGSTGTCGCAASDRRLAASLFCVPPDSSLNGLRGPRCGGVLEGPAVQTANCANGQLRKRPAAQTASSVPCRRMVGATDVFLQGSAYLSVPDLFQRSEFSAFGIEQIKS